MRRAKERFSGKTRRTGLGITILMTLATALSACNAILGIEDLEELPADGGGSSKLVELASGQNQPAAIALDDYNGFVYWVNEGDGSVNRITKSGGTVETVHSAGESTPRGITVGLRDSEYYAFWTNSSGGSFTGSSEVGSVWGVAVDGTPPPGQEDTADLEPVPIPPYDPTGIATASGAIFCTTPTKSAVYRWTKGYPNASGPLPATDAQEPFGIATDGTYLYWTDRTAGEIVRYKQVPPADRTPLAEAQGGPTGITLGDSYVYWTAKSDNAIRRTPVTGVIGGPDDLATAADGVNGPTAIAVDSNYVYWTNETAGTIMRVPKSGVSGAGGGGGSNSVETLASNQNGPNAIAVDNDAVYWVNKTGNTVMKYLK